jgi:hypothetical protein
MTIPPRSSIGCSVNDDDAAIRDYRASGELNLCSIQDYSDRGTDTAPLRTSRCWTRLLSDCAPRETICSSAAVLCAVPDDVNRLCDYFAEGAQRSGQIGSHLERRLRSNSYEPASSARRHGGVEDCTTPAGAIAQRVQSLVAD